MNGQYEKVVDILKNNTPLEPIFEELKKWYKDNGVDAYYFEIVKSFEDKTAPEYEIYSYSNLNNIIDVTSVSTLNKFTSKAFKYFKELCVKYNLYTDYIWETETIYNYDFVQYIRNKYYKDFIIKEFDNIKTEYAKCNFDNVKVENVSILYFASQNDYDKYFDDGTCYDIKNKINNDFNAYIKNIDYIKTSNINIDITDSIEFESQEFVDKYFAS